MTRQIKFRAWDEENEKFFYTDDGHGFEFCLSPIAGNYVTKLTDETLLDSDISWQQFTGIRDKNGKDIYEGDIVKDKDDEAFNSKGLIYQIKWNNLYASFGLFHQDSCKYSDLILVSEMGIIGNIYENPELLK